MPPWENVRRLSFDFMTATSFLLGAFLVLCELFANANLRRFIFLAVAISGALNCVIGVVLKLSGAPLMRYVWKTEDIYWDQFAFFRYHGNAGAFLNLVWPLILVFTRRAYRPTGTLAEKIIWTFSALACGSALLMNAAKAAMVIGLLILPWPFYTLLLRLKPNTLFLLGACTQLLIAGALYASSQLVWEGAFERNTKVSGNSADFTGRWASNRDNLKAVPEAGFFGHGPGLFPIAFPYQNSPMRNVGANVRDYAHEDYLQTVLEWGWLGTVWWTLWSRAAFTRRSGPMRNESCSPARRTGTWSWAPSSGSAPPSCNPSSNFPFRSPPFGSSSSFFWPSAGRRPRY